MSSHAFLDAAAQERKARLAKLKSLKRKQSESEDVAAKEEAVENAPAEAPTPSYLSGRNYDITTRGPKLGFEHNPAEDQDTAEQRARELAEVAKAESAKEEKEDKPLDLFKLQPKKPNWDLKRDVEKRMERLNVQTENAIARLVRQRIVAQKKKQEEQARVAGDDDQGATGFAGEELVTALHAREQQEEEEERKEREEDALDDDGFV